MELENQGVVAPQETPAADTSLSPQAPAPQAPPPQPRGVVIDEDMLIQMGVPPEEINNPEFRAKWLPGLINTGLATVRERHNKRLEEEAKQTATVATSEYQQKVDQLWVDAAAKFPSNAGKQLTYVQAQTLAIGIEEGKKQGAELAETRIREDIGKRQQLQHAVEQEFAAFESDPKNSDLVRTAARADFYEYVKEHNFRTLDAAANSYRKYAMRGGGPNVLNFNNRAGSGGDGSAFYEGVSGEGNDFSGKSPKELDQIAAKLVAGIMGKP